MVISISVHSVVLKNVYMLHRFVYCVYGKSSIIYETIKKGNK